MPPPGSKKLAVLHQLSQESEPIRLAELLEKLGKGFVERSVRRWLAEMIESGLIEKLGTTKATKYRVIHREKRHNCFSFDEIRVRYRQHRRALLREIITEKMVGAALKKYISTETKKMVKKEDQAEFFQDLIEDLQYININRIVGIGITPEELNAWIAAAQASYISTLFD